MTLFRLPSAFCLSFVLLTPALANPCSQADIETAAYWENYYTPENAYAFGEKIKKSVLAKDLAGLFSLVEGELKNGPTKAAITDKAFEEIFNADWVDLILSEDASCSPMGYRGFMLGHGMIWYNKSDTGWSITAINGAMK